MWRREVSSALLDWHTRIRHPQLASSLSNERNQDHGSFARAERRHAYSTFGHHFDCNHTAAFLP